MYSDLPEEDLGSTVVADDPAASSEAAVMTASGDAPEAVAVAVESDGAAPESDGVAPELDAAVAETDETAPVADGATSAADSILEDIPAIVRRPTALFSFKSEMARAMQVVADQERARIDTSVGEEETVQVEKIHVRAAAEAAQLGKHADEDISLVNAWYEDQVKQLREAADRQIADRGNGLEEALTHHGTLIEAEVQSVHTAVEGYRGSLDAFFGRLAEEQDPSVIARLAGTLPDLPDLEVVRAVARSRAMRAIEDNWSTETVAAGDDGHANGQIDGQTDGTGHFELERELVPVMDPDAVKQRVSILSGVAIPVGRPGPSALWSGRSSSSPAESDADEATPAVEAELSDEDAAVPATPAAASTIWNSANGDSEGA